MLVERGREARGRLRLHRGEGTVEPLVEQPEGAGEAHLGHVGHRGAAIRTRRELEPLGEPGVGVGAAVLDQSGGDRVAHEAERDALKGTLIGLQGELDVKLKEVDEALAKTGLQEDARKAAEAMRAELEGKRQLAAERLNELGEAVQASWPDVKTKADTAVAQLERSLATARQGAGTGATEEQQANDGH